MAFQIRRAHRFLPPPQDQIALRTSNRAKREQGPGTFSIFGNLTLFILFQLLLPPRASAVENWLIYADKSILQKPGEPNVVVEGFSFVGFIPFQDLNDPSHPMYSQPATAKANYIYEHVFKKDQKPNTKKPVITKLDDTYVVLYSTRAMNFVCTKKDDAFTQVDAPLVQPTGHKVTLLDSANQPIKENGKEKKVDARAFLCDLESRDKGNTRITFNIEKKAASTFAGNNGVAAADENPKKEVELSQAIRVHELYRFRITSGPVFSTLTTRNRNFSVITNSSGQQVISSSRANDSPANFPIFLKCYCFSENGRDILEKPGHFYEYFSPIIGVNLVDNPLKNFYAGLSFEPVLGVDFVIGAHFAKISQLAGGFADGQIVTIANPPPVTTKFLTGGFAGITVDVGIVGSWLGTQFTKTIKEGFR